MNTRIGGILLLSLGLVGLALADEAPTPVAAWVAAQIESGDATSAAVAEVRGETIDTYGFGHRSLPDGAVPDADTQFQIGSVTKVFTHLLLAELQAAGRVSDTSSVGELMPAPFRPRNPAVAAITLQALATHSSGLPRQPANLTMADPADPYADYDARDLLAGLRMARDKQPLGHFYAYSNFGVGLLGHLLGRADGSDYRTAVTQRVIAPLALSRTAFEPDTNAATPTSGGKSVPAWTFDDSLAGAGALWSSAGDMGRLIQAGLGLSPEALKHDASRDFAVVVENAGSHSVTRVWHVAKAGEAPIYWHNGGVAGFRSFVGFRPDQQRGVAILVSGDSDPTAIGLQALGQTQAPPAAKAIDRSILGQYALTDDFGIGVFERDGRLLTQASGQSPMALHAVGDDWYALADADASVRFVRKNDTVTGLELAQGGMLQPASRVADVATAVATAAARTEIAIAAEALQDYVGSYDFAPGATLTVKLVADGLEVQLTGQEFMPVYPRSRDRFFYKVVDAELAFERGADGAVSAVVLHQGGVEQRAPRVSNSPDK